MSIKTFLLFLMALVLISVSFHINSLWLSIMGGAIYGWGAHSASRYGLERLNSLILKAGMSAEFNDLLSRVKKELNQNG